MSSAGDLLGSRSISIAAFLILLYLVGGAVYRLYLSPLAKFPGPKLAALTLWYEFYYDVIKSGRYTWEIEKMHQKYGPIVRISPFELHINDPDYYDELYAGGSKQREKYPWAAKLFGNSSSMLGTIPHDHHRIRRQALNPYFSKQSVTKLEPSIRAVVENLCRRLREFRSTNEPVNVGDAYAALAIDVITEYAFAKSYGCVDRPDFAAEWPRVIEAVSAQSALNKQFGWLLPMMTMMPESLVAKLNPDMLLIIGFQKARPSPAQNTSLDTDRVFQDMVAQATAVTEGRYDSYQKSTQPSLFKELINSDLPRNEVTIERLAEEGQTVVAAGQVTTAHFLRTTTFFVLNNPSVLSRLKAELSAAMPADGTLPPCSTLERLPYLSAVIQEGFRKTYGVTQRLPRISPNAPLIYKDYTIPPGTPVGMTSIFIHDNPDIFPNPETFNPDRWLADKTHRLDRYLVNFSKGSRACLGINLAKAEIVLTLAAVFHRFDLELYETSWEADVEIVHDHFNPAPRATSKGIRVLVK